MFLCPSIRINIPRRDLELRRLLSFPFHSITFLSLTASSHPGFSSRTLALTGLRRFALNVSAATGPSFISFALGSRQLTFHSSSNEVVCPSTLVCVSRWSPVPLPIDVYRICLSIEPEKIREFWVTETTRTKSRWLSTLANL